MTITVKEHLRARGQNFRDIRVLARLKKNEVAALCGVNEATVRRWNRENSHPAWAYTLVAYHAGWFPWAGWCGWFIADGLLYSPQYKDGYTPAEVELIGYQRARLACVATERRTGYLKAR